MIDSPEYVILDAGITLTLSTSSSDEVGDQYDYNQTSQARSNDDRYDVGRAGVGQALFVD